MAQSGYAAVREGTVLIDTVSTHKRAAMVNWLVAYGRFMVPAGMGEFAILGHFDRLAAPAGVSVKPVNVEVA
jgi:hypothetical protein